MVRYESVLIALFGTLGGLGLGTFLGWAVTRAANATFRLPVPSLVAVAVLGAAAGIAAAWLPARRAARLDVLQAIAAERFVNGGSWRGLWPRKEPQKPGGRSVVGQFRWRGGPPIGPPPPPMPPPPAGGGGGGVVPPGFGSSTPPPTGLATGGPTIVTGGPT